ncbi:hypothetical protein OG943_41895 [Amycolatopsis sp. NBC_00345]|uniref:hypothetical protein n=1 Tax=Amycolatopsis sp. NBC_00345 TaxID=2975955 RepID=UPI002E263C43
MQKVTVAGLVTAGFLVVAPVVAAASMGPASAGDSATASAPAPAGDRVTATATAGAPAPRSDDEYPAAAAMGVLALGSAGIALVRHKTRR